MKALAFALALVASAPALGGDWSTADTVREGAYLGLLYIDYRQTREGSVNNPAQYHESNPLLGRDPSDVAVRNAVAASALVHAAVAYALPRGYREIWQYVFIGGEAYAVGHNYSVGLRLPF